ncbi:hypothetical protein J437_LFUL005528, partial [Ladona fulva]
MHFVQNYISYWNIMDSSCNRLQGDIKKMPYPHCIRRIHDLIPARVVLYFLSFSGFLVSFMMRTDINLAMVAMVRMPNTNPLEGNGTAPSSCVENWQDSSNSVNPNETSTE